MQNGLLEPSTRLNRDTLESACRAVAELLEQLDLAQLYEAAAHVSFAKDLLDASLRELDVPAQAGSGCEADGPGRDPALSF